MSGFVGLANAHEAPVDVPLLERLTGAMAYCAPDGRDTWVGGSIGLGHALLSLTPEADGLEAERQPASLDGRSWIASDARLDGRNELTRELRAAGRDVPTDAPDAHLVLHAHALWGERCPEHLLGDFAFAIWDDERGELLCARDHFGLVPLYYADLDGGLAFGNVLRCLLAHPEVSDTLNEQAIGDFLAFDCNHDLATTTFADIRSLPPAHTMTWRDGQVRLRQYWELEVAPPEVRLQHPQEYVERFTATLDRAMDDRMRSGRVTAQLSGGMDSSSLVATAREVLTRRGSPPDLRAYTIVFDALMPEDDEGRYAEQIADRLKVPLETIVADEWMARPPDGDLLWDFPEPLRIPNQLADYELLARAAGFAPVLLTGQGGDPLFAAPPAVGATLRARRLPRPGIRTALRRWRGIDRAAPPDWIAGDLAARLDLAGRLRAAETDARRVKGVSMMTAPYWPTMFSRAHGGALGLPVRLLFPYFDLRVVRCVAETPVLPWRRDKRLLREAMRDRLPPAVLERPKTPLYSPASGRPEPWLRLAQQPAVRRQRERLLEVPELSRYVALPRARERVESPSSPGMFQFERCLALAHWLQTRKDDHAPRSA